MLGYEVYDQEEMVIAIFSAMKIFNESSDIYKGLGKAHDFLQGLRAEGYFD